MTRAVADPPAAPPSADQASRLRALMEQAARASRQSDRRLPPVAPRPGHASVVAIASGKGGVGKTTIAVNLAIALARRGTRAALVDADIGTANADLLCGLAPRRRLDALIDAPGRPSPSMADIAVDAPGGFRLVPGAVGLVRAASLDAEQRRAIAAGIDQLERSCDTVLIDAAAGVGPQVLTMLAMADASIVVATPEPTSIADAYALIKCALADWHPVRGPTAGASARGFGPRGARLALVVNQASGMREAVDVHKRISSVAERFLGTRIPLLGVIGADEAVGRAVRAKRPVMLLEGRHPVARDLDTLAANLAQHLRPVGTKREGEASPRLSDLVRARAGRWSSNVRHRNG